MKLEFVSAVESLLFSGAKQNKRSLEKLAASFGIQDKNLVKELTELAIVRQARKLAHVPNHTIAEKFDAIVSLYKNQVNLSHRTSQSVMLQQYSTPAPIGYLMGIFCRLDQFSGDQRALEPSAGNGLLTIAGNEKNFDVNEIDPVRNENLRTQRFHHLTQTDATKSLGHRSYDAVVTNPPFGRLSDFEEIEGYPIQDLDHLMAIRALEALTDNGRAAIIIGGHTQWDQHGRITQGKNRIFFNYLHRHYHVVDTILIDGHALYSRQGTSFNVRLILIDGRKEKPEGVAPLRSTHDEVVDSFDTLFDRVTHFIKNPKPDQPTSMKLKLKLKAKALAAKLKIQNLGSLDMPYIPASQICNSLDLDTPDSMGYEIHLALKKLKTIVGSVEDYVQKKLGYATHAELCKALSAEQSDAVALAIYNIEQRSQALIVGDQTGIGKGRIAAAMVRYGNAQGLSPIFITEKPNLFSDLYRDLKAIGSQSLKPYIVNARDSKSHVKDEEGNVTFEALDSDEQKKIIDSGKLPSSFDYVMLTYSQISGGEINKRGDLVGKSPKGSWVEHIAKGNIMILDEAHNASGESNTGKILQDVIRQTKGVTFLSATFAKRPDNMPIYAMKTAMSEANMSKNALVEGIEKGGVALQEVLSAQLVQHGQMIRRERSFEGIEVNYITLDEKASEHKAISDNITQIVRDVIAFQKNFIDAEVESLDRIAAKTNTGSNVEKRKGTKGAGVDSTPYFSKVFQVVNQMLFAIKAEAVADRAILRLKEGKKPVIAFSSTMGSFIESLTDADGRNKNEDGTKINADFATVLQKGLDGVLRYTERDETGKSVFKKFEVTDLSPEAQAEYNRIAAQIRSISSGIVISPIDLVKQKLTQAGYRVAEVTGRKLEVELRQARHNEGLPETTFTSKGDVSIPFLASKLIPPFQLKVIRQNIAGEEGDYFVSVLSEVQQKGEALLQRRLEKEYLAYRKANPSLAHLFHKEVAVPTLHYFNASSDWFIFEFDKKTDLFYGYTILGGDLQNAEFGNISCAELFADYGMKSAELDLHFNPAPIAKLTSGLNGVSAKPTTPVRRIGLIKSRPREFANDAFRKFQNNQVDVLMINQSGSTGASAHALPTKLVSQDQVKQRVMILLQAELDINTEVQKRGRINRTGQIYKPIYDYVFSAIPAEKRLMMMLQKKLKSLDANTTSNQKQSEAVLSVDDFLNKIGDRVVTSYLKENPEINALLDDPLHLSEASADSGKATILEDAAHRVSGRVAVLPTDLQEKFYATILKLYKDEVEYLKQIDEYDLEVDVLDLKAVTLDKSVKIVGKGGQSAFGDNTYIEKCEVNVLRKPYSVTELENVFHQTLAGKASDQVAEELIDNYQLATQADLKRQHHEIRKDYAEKIQNILEEKAFKALPNETQREAYIKTRTADLEKAREGKLKKETEKSKNRSEAMLAVFRFFPPGRKLFYPLDMENESSAKSLAVSLGVRTDPSGDKPFLPSNMKLQIAIASGKKRIDIPLSRIKDVNAIMGVSAALAQPSFDDLLTEWQQTIRAVTKDRGIAYLVTGNLLQSYGDESFNKGRLISYTTLDGKTLKGRLLPDGWEPNDSKQGENKIKVPILKAIKVIASLPAGQSISTDSGLTLAKTYDHNFKLLTPASRSAGGDVYLDPALNALMDTGRFDKTSNFMVASFPVSNLKQVVSLLQQNHNDSVSLVPYQLDMIIDEVEPDKGIETISDSVKMEVSQRMKARQTENENSSPQPDSVNTSSVLRLRLALKAKALKVKLKLAA